MRNKMDPNQRYELITRNLQEVLGDEKLKELLSINRQPLKLYWGTATTGKPHIAYFLPITKIGDFLQAGCEVTILLADLHAYLDNLKAPWRLLSLRTRYYEAIIKAMLRAINVPIDKLKFVMGTEYQLSKEYTLDMYKMSSIISQHDAKKGGSEVVKQVANPLLSGLLYPCLQALDEHYLHVDAQFGGVDQRKIFTLAEKYLPMMGYSKRIHLMNPMGNHVFYSPPFLTVQNYTVPGLTGSKMSASEEDTKIDLLDSPAVVARKIKKAFCEPGNIESNGILAFARYVIFPVFKRTNKLGFEIKRPDKFGGDVVYFTYQELENAFSTQEIHPGDLKQAITSYINQLLAPIIDEFQDSALVELSQKAYADNSDEEKSANHHSTNEIELNGMLNMIGVATAPHSTIKPSVLDLRVGRIISVKKHPTADSLYVEEIDVGEDEPRSVVSGLVPYISMDKIQAGGGHCVLICNCRPIKMKDILSNGILLAAYKHSSPKCAEILRPHANSKPGDKVWFEGYGDDCDTPVNELKPKKKMWEAIQTDLKTDNELCVKWRQCVLRTSQGPIRVESLKGAPIN